MKINSITEFKKYLAETYSAQDARNTFEGILTSNVLQQIESTFKTEYGVVTENDTYMYYVQLMDQKGLIVDRIVYCPTGEWNKFEWWSASSTSEESLSFPTWNLIAEWCNKRHNINLPLLQN